MSLPTNIVNFACPVTEAPVYVDQSFVISEGGKAELPPKASQMAGGWSLAVNCDTNPSSQVAEEFIHACGGDNHVYCASKIVDWKDIVPGELSFYFAFTFKFPGTGGDSSSHKIYFGQGKKLTVHNWWIGGAALVTKSFAAFDPARAVFVILNTSRNAVVQIFEVSGDVNQFSLYPWIGSGGAEAETANIETTRT